MSSNTGAAQLSADCLAIAEQASRVALAGFGTRPATREKGAHDLVTEFDLKTQAEVVRLLSERYPGVPIVGEEGDFAEVGVGRDLTFVVDPIDGTTNFAHGHPVWCVSVGVLRGGEPIAGGIAAPSLALSWRGFRTDEGGELYRTGERRRVSETASLDTALIATGFPPNRDHAPENNFDSFVAVKRRALAVRRCGSAAIDIAFVADGTYDAYWERRLKLWDSAAAAAFVLAAGGTITALDGGPAKLENGNIVASNGRVHDQLVAAIAAS
ncbi:MAG: inositol monophosphatase [Myxococcales bacterium]|nr:inositol monophosphatase [Myxococcales bacterium]